MTTLKVLLLLAVATAAGTGQELADNFDQSRYLDPFDPNPRFIVKNGHLMVMTGRNKDLQFRSSGTGRVKINGEDIAALKGSIAGSSDQTGIAVLPPDSSGAASVSSSQLAIIEAKMAAMNVTIELLRQRTPASPFPLRRLRTLARRVTRLERLLNKNECEPKNPCKNGAQCEDSFNRYFCRCLDGFTGTNCDEDVNECERYQGTELGCQNGGTCLNTFGAFHCVCPAAFQGVRCTVQFNDCRNASSHEICGSGECFDLPRTSSGVARYRCVCYQGFTKSIAHSETAPCDADVDECATGIHRCSRSPPVACFNTRAGYQCGPCPAGYTGDGYSCTPSADQCNVNNGGCSLSPRVSCFSNLGRVICGPCPPGFAGDGTTCTQLDGDICSSSNGGCSPQARCVANTAISATYRDCLCPPGTTGTGIGPNGCTRVTGDSSSMSCGSRPCQNGGTCIPYRGGVYCSCSASFSGTFCERRMAASDACSSSPCQNGGVCSSLPIGFSCFCTNEFTGPTCGQPRQLCGGVLDAPSGVLSFPLANGTAYSANLTCSWVIKNSNGEGKVLNITFSRFNVEFSARCAFDFLEVINGPSRDYKSFGRFCGTELPKKTGNFISSFNAVMLRFHSDHSVGYDGFSLQWSTVEPKCGGLYNISNSSSSSSSYGVMIESPGFPHHYPSLLDCFWDFVAPFGQRIQFVFTHLDIEASPNCTYDYLEIREASPGGFSTRNSHTIERFCNWTDSSENLVPPPITTSGSYAQVVFHSDHGIAGKGFQMLFHTVPGICGGLLTGSGTFNPPLTTTVGGSLVYENGVSCEWLIRVLPNERVLLRFLRFALEQDTTVMTNRNGVWRQSNRTCMFDFVEVFDGGSDAQSAPLMARLCGSVKPPEMISSGRYMRVRFRSDVSVARQGFTAHYIALCGGEYDALSTSKTLESPNHPEPVVSKNCTYLIRAPFGHIIKLEIFEMDIEFDHRCLFDYILVHETGQKYCGKLRPPPLYSLGNELRFTFVNDDTKPSRGFKARYSSIEVGCGGTLKQGQPMVAITPEHIKDNPLVNQCFWELQANKSFIVVVKFLHTEASTDTRLLGQQQQNLVPCAQRSSAYLMVNDTDGTLIKRFCPDQLPPAISSTGTKLFITYVFRPPPPPPATTQLPLNSTLKPKMRLANNTRFTLSPNATIIEQIAFNLNQIEPMAIDASLPATINRNAFYGNYFFKKARKYCSRNLFAPSGVVQSPAYPRRYPSNVNCTWIIHVENGFQIRLNFSYFQIEPASDVNGQCFDYLLLRNGRNADSPLIAKMCGDRPLPDIVSHSNYLFMQFISDSSMQRGGFSVTYTSVEEGCGGLLTADSGSIESPDYPLSYSSNLNCEYRIIVSQGSAIQLVIVALNLETPTNGQCLFDYIQIWDAETDAGRSFGRFCSLANNANGVITSSSNRLLVRFVSDATVNQGGFKINYQTLCNRTLAGTHGVIESPNYPHAHPHMLNCNYHLLAPMGNNITIIFTALSLELGYNCMFDHLNISQVDRWHRPLMLDQVEQINASPQNREFNVTTVKVLCGNLTGHLPPPIQLTSNEAIISFFSDESRSIQSGFRLEFGSVGCGGRFDERPSGNFSSPGYPNPYPRDVECLWHIKAPLGRRIDLEVHDLDMEYSKSCSFDFVQVLGGPDEKSPELARLCNQISDRKVSSIGNYMTIRMMSDGSSTRKGFTASFTTENSGCGGKFTTMNGALTSPNYGRGNTYDPSSDCSFVLDNEGHFIYEIAINDIDIPSQDPNCSSYLAIYDSASEEEGRLMTRVCNSNFAEQTTNVFNSTNSVLFIRFKADGVTAGHGWNITYRSVCGKVLQISDQEDPQVVSSPNFPHVGSMDDHCHFVLKAKNPRDQVTVRLTHLQSFNIPAAYHPRASNGCSVNYLEFYDSTERLPMKRLHHFCSDAIPPPIVSSGDSLLLVSFFTVFRALVSSSKSFCGGDFFVIEGYITNPGYPNSYTSLIECIWVLKASPGNRYELAFDDFELEESDYCNGDYVEIRQGNSSGPLIGDRRLCGKEKNNLPSLDTAFSGDVWIKFRTDEANVAKGFMLHFKLASNVVLSGETGQISSPGYPNAFHFFNRTFTYQVMVPPAQYVKLHFDEVQLNGDEISSGLCSIKISLYNGLVNFGQVDPASLSSNVMSSSHLVAMPTPKISYCSSRLPPPFVSDNNAVTLVYTAAFFYHLPSKFHLTWTAINRSALAAFDEHVDGIPSDVNSTFNFFLEKGQSVNLVDGNYSQYGSDINWFLTTANSMHFNLSSALISFHPATSCWINKITVSAWGSTGWRTWKTLCNGFSKQVELAGTNMIRIHLQYSQITESGSYYPRFNLTVFPVCGGNFTDPNGIISSEDAKDGYSQEDNVQCSWLVKVRPGRTIQVFLEYYTIGYASPKCAFSQGYLEIRNGHSDDSPLLVERLCGGNSTGFVLPETSSNVAHITYKSTSKQNSFRLAYKEIGIECGGELVIHSMTDSVVVSSPGYPASPEHGDLVCDYIIRGPITSGLLLSFSNEQYSPCDKNNTFLEVYSGGTELSSLIDRFCMPTYRQDSVVINSHITLLRYVLKSRDFRSKFNATLRPDNCNREFFVSGPADKLQLPFAGKALVGPNFQCSLHLRTHPSYYIVANITSINLQGSDCSSGDVIEFRDSPTAKYSFERRCAPHNSTSSNVIPTLNSFQNELFISFQRKNYRPNATDNSGALQKKNVGVTLAVEAKYRRCGQTVLGSLLPKGTLRSPGYPGGISRRLYCSYKLIGEPGTVFRLSFARFNLGRTWPNVNISIFRCQKRLQISGNLYMKRNMAQTYGCSNEVPPDFTSLSNMMELYFFASELKPREGFNIRYEMVPSNESCSGLLDLPHGQVISANFDNLNYTGLIGCAWEIKAGSNQSATLVIDTFDVAGDCSNSSITTTTVTGDPHYQFSSFNCITKEIAPQTTKVKYIMPVYSRSENANPIILLSFNRTDVGISRGLRGEYFITKNCGGFFTDFVGEFTSPNYPSDLGAEVFCNWYFRISEGAMEGSNFNGYRLIFTEFDIGENCDEDYFFILKPRYEQHSREKFCRRDGLPKPIYVGHDLLLSFVSSRNLSLSGGSSSQSSSSSSGSLKKFKFRLERAQHGCGGVMLAGMNPAAGSFIQSPNYANASDTFSTSRQYSSNIECVWEIRSLPDFHLEFNFNARFDLEESANCSNDFLLFEEKQLEFVEGDREVEKWKVLKRLCGHKTPGQIVSSTNVVRVTFRTNEKVVGDGFSVQFKQACGGLFQEEKGTITSPRYNEGAYSNELSCLYRIERAPHEYISVTFEDFDLEYHSSCIFDRVFIYSGGSHQNKSTPRSGPFCGNSLPPAVSALGALEVQFKSDYYFNKRGFKFSYAVTSCGGNITAGGGSSSEGGTIVGPEIPPNFVYKTCVWRITAPEVGNSVAVRITALELANEHCRSECCNYLKVYDSAYLNYQYTSQLGYLCADDHQDLTFKSSGNDLSIVFRQGVLEAADKAASFRLVYWSTPGPKAGCGGTVVLSAGSGGPSRDGGQEVGVITSPDVDGDSNYEPNLSCLWSVKGGDSATSILQLEFERFDVEAGTNDSTARCDNDWLDVLDGTTMHAPLLARLCGSGIVPEKLQSSGESLLLHFVSNDNNVTGHGFRLRYSALNQTCGGFLYAEDDKKELTSPGYPSGGYSTPQQCTWTLGTSSAYYKKPVVLIFTELDLNCSRGDYVQLVEKRNYGYDRVVGKAITLCTSASPVKIITTEQISLTFRADTTAAARQGISYDNQVFANSQLADGRLKSQYRGFRMTYHSTLCNETLDGMDSGYAYNRYWPNADYIHRTSSCTIRVVVPPGHQIALYFSAFSFYHCHYSNFTIFEGNSSLAKAIYCNMRTPPSPFFSTSNNLTLVIRSSYMSLPDPDYSKPAYTLNRVQYSFNYLSSPRAAGPPGCGGNLTGLSGVFSSPLYPNPLTEERVCAWRLDSNGYHSLTLKFSFFQLSASCDANYVVVYDGDEDVEDRKLATFCNSDTPAPIRSQSSRLLVKLYTTTSNYDVGFLASYSVNTYEPKIRGRVVSAQTFRYYKYQNTFSHL